MGGKPRKVPTRSVLLRTDRDTADGIVRRFGRWHGWTQSELAEPLDDDWLALRDEIAKALGKARKGTWVF